MKQFLLLLFLITPYAHSMLKPDDDANCDYIVNERIPVGPHSTLIEFSTELTFQKLQQAIPDLNKTVYPLIGLTTLACMRYGSLPTLRPTALPPELTKRLITNHIFFNNCLQTAGKVLACDSSPRNCTLLIKLAPGLDMNSIHADTVYHYLNTMMAKVVFKGYPVDQLEDLLNCCSHIIKLANNSQIPKESRRKLCFREEAENILKSRETLREQCQKIAQQ